MTAIDSPLFVIDALGDGGGAETSLVSLVLQLHHAGNSPEVLCLGGGRTGLFHRLSSAGVSVNVISASTFIGKVATLRRWVRTRKPSIVHCSLIYSAFVCRLALFGTGLPRLESIVNTTYDEVRTKQLGVRRWKLSLLALADRATVRFAGGEYHALTEAVARHAARTLRIPANRIHIVPRGRSELTMGRRSADRRDRTRLKLDLSADQLVLLSCAREDHQKGHLDLIRATRQIVAEHPDLQIVIAGRPGSASKEITALITDLGIDANVRRIGHRDDVPDLLCAADLFVFPSLYEGLGGALIEAMALEVPIVASDAPAIVEVLESGQLGALHKRGDPDDLARVVLEALGDPGTGRSRAELARARFLEKYELGVVTEQMKALYEDVIQSSVNEQRRSPLWRHTSV